MEEAFSHLHGAGYALDPAFIKTSIWDDAKVMTGLHRTLEVMSLAHPEGVVASEHAIREFNVFKAEQGAYAHPNCMKMVGGMPAYQWFQQFGGSTSYLQWFAVRILAMVSSSSASERSFSKLGWIKNARRNRLTEVRTNKLMYVQYNLHLQNEIEDLDYMEDCVHHDLDQSLLDDDLLDVSIEDLDIYQ